MKIPKGHSRTLETKCQDTRRSTSGSAQFLRDKLVSWSSKKQKSIAISHHRGMQHGHVWMLVLDTLDGSQPFSYGFAFNNYMYSDNQSALAICTIILWTYSPKALPRERFEFLPSRLGMKESTCADTMADMNILANDAPAEQAPTITPPTIIDDQILPLSKWVPIGKSNCVLDVQKSQRNPIFPIVVSLLKNTNFFRAFTASSTILAIYIQQFWDTMCFNSSTGLYSCQLDEQWFNLHKDLLRDALDITPTNDNNPFVAPPLSDTVIEYVNTMGYPYTLRNENLKLPTEDQVIIEEPASSTGTLSSLQNLDKELSFTNQFFIEKPQEEEPEKTNTESEVQSMVTVPIHQDTSSVPPITSSVIDLTVSHPVSTTIHAPLPTSTTIVTATTTTTSLPPPPPQPQ
ncbi:hypothetical protein Tco_1069130 [Tanacetum coccineum]|uniref:Uncharacterized protein n=1 Tax=Tanacetum coccineum TaxID=301880 RepID=A0ABQ5HJU5_9ASTR